MGHYDSCYEADAKEEAERKRLEINETLVRLVDGLDDDEKKLILFLAYHMEEYAPLIKFFQRTH